MRTSVQSPKIAAADSGSGHRHSSPATVGGSYRLLHDEEMHRRDHAPLREGATNLGSHHPSKIPVPRSKDSSFKHPTATSYGLAESTTLDTSLANLVCTDARNSASGHCSGSSGESSEGEVVYQSYSQERVSPSHPMVIQATDAIEKALYGDCSGKNGVSVATERGQQGTEHRRTLYGDCGGKKGISVAMERGQQGAERCNARGGDGREPAVAVSNENQLRNEPLQEIHHRTSPGSRVESPRGNAAEMHSTVVGNGQTQVTFHIPQKIAGERHSDPQRGVESLRVQSSSRRVEGVRARTETHPPRKKSRKLFDRKEFEHTQPEKGICTTIPPVVPAHQGHSTDLHSSLPVAAEKMSAVTLKIPRKKADFSPNLPLPPINKRTAKSSSTHLPASGSTPSTSEGQICLQYYYLLFVHE